MKKSIFLVFVIFSFSKIAFTQFSGTYDPSNWTLSQPGSFNGSINSSGAPNTIVINGSNAFGAGRYVNFIIPASVSGSWSFQWTYHTNDDAPNWDPAGVFVNGSFIQLTDNTGPKDQSGLYNAGFVTAGTTIGFSVYTLDNTGGNALLTISVFSPPGGVLPVKLTSFTATRNSSNVELEWKAAEEINLLGYEVQRSADGASFKPIGSVSAQSRSQYNFIDQNVSGNTNYYRLKMVDQNGTFTYSAILSIKMELSNNLVVFPNPCKDWLWINLTSNHKILDLVKIFNTSGQLLITQSIQLNEGNNSMQFDLSKFPSGIYFMKFENSGHRVSVSKR